MTGGWRRRLWTALGGSLDGDVVPVDHGVWRAVEVVRVDPAALRSQLLAEGIPCDIRPGVDGRLCVHVLTHDHERAVAVAEDLRVDLDAPVVFVGPEGDTPEARAWWDLATAGSPAEADALVAALVEVHIACRTVDLDGGAVLVTVDREDLRHAAALVRVRQRAGADLTLDPHAAGLRPVRAPRPGDRRRRRP